MNVYFTASIVGKKKYLAHYQSIIDVVKKEGHSIKADHILNASENQINMQSEHKREQFHKKLKKWIMDAQCMIVETSFPSISVGFEISLALNLNKPVLVLFTDEAPTLLSGYNDEKMICQQYTPATVEDIVQDFLHYVKGTSEHRFTFFITTEMNQFLEEISTNNKIPKSVYLRQLIDSARKK
jgi:hypothetical protein